MKSNFFIQIYIFELLAKEIFLINVYCDFQIYHAIDYPKYIISSEGIIYPKKPYEVCYKKNGRDMHDFLYNFEKIKQDLEKKICIYMIGCQASGVFNFDYASINEYIISVVDYKNWYSLYDYDSNIKINFTYNSICGYNKHPIIANPSGDLNKNYIFCLEPRNDITKFYIDDQSINRNYYKGKTAKYFINNDTYNIPIKDLFSINGFNNLEIFLDTISLEISSIQNGKGKIFNGNEELFEGSFFNPNFNLTFKNIINEDI